MNEVNNLNILCLSVLFRVSFSFVFATRVVDDIAASLSFAHAAHPFVNFYGERATIFGVLFICCSPTGTEFMLLGVLVYYYKHDR